MSSQRKEKLNNAYFDVTTHHKKLPDDAPLSRKDVLELTLYALSDPSELIRCLRKISRIQYMTYRKRILIVINQLVDNGEIAFFLSDKDAIQSLPIPKTVNKERTAITQILRVLSNKRRLRHLLEKLGKSSLKQVVNNIFVVIKVLDNEYSDEIKSLQSSEAELYQQFLQALTS